MDFGDILKAWESAGSHTQASGRDAGDMEKLLDQYPPEGTGYESKDVRQRNGMKTDDRWKRMKIQDTLDLHGMTAQEAGNSLEAFMKASRKQGYTKVLIIHGKGNHSGGEPILTRVVRQYLESCPFAGRTGVPERKDGGSGAVWVILKQDYRSR